MQLLLQDISFSFLRQKYFISFRIMSGRLRPRVDAVMTPCRSSQNAPLCRRHAETERAKLILNCSQAGLLRSTGSASPVFGRNPHAGLKSEELENGMTGVGTTNVAKERRAPSTNDSSG